MFLFFLCRISESNRYGPFGPTDFKSVVSTNFTNPTVLIIGLEPMTVIV